MSATVWRVVAGAFTVAVLFAAVLVAWNLLAPQGEIHTSTQQQSYSQPVSQLVFLDFESSDITVSAGTGSSVEIQRNLRWTGDNAPVQTETWLGDALNIKHSCGDADSDICSIRYIVKVPKNVAVEAETSSGDVTVRGLSGAMRLSTVSGDVTLAGLTGKLDVKAISGDVSTSDIGSSEVDVKAISGDVELAFSAAPSDIVVETTSGDASVKVPSGSGPYQLQVQTVSGDQRVSVDRESKSQRAIIVHTTSGDVSVAYT